MGERPRLFVAPDGTRWVRSGECCRCGECCRGTEFPGLGVKRLPVVAGHCPALDPGNECTVHGSDDPYYRLMCADFPTHPSQVGPGTGKPSCSYRFERAG